MTKLIRRSFAVLACALPLAAAVAACDGDVTYSEPLIEETTFAPSLGVDLTASTKSPTGLYYRDITTGTMGDAAAAGDTAFLHYTLWLPNGAQVETNSGGPSFGFILGRRMVIAGFEEGVTGMKKGGQRQLIIPPSLGYGRAAQGRIPSNSILVFNIQIDSIK